MATKYYAICSRHLDRAMKLEDNKKPQDVFLLQKKQHCSWRDCWQETHISVEYKAENPVLQKQLAKV